MRKSLFTATVVALALVATVAFATGTQKAETCLQETSAVPAVESNPQFRVLSTTRIQLQPGVEIDVVNDAETPRIEFLAADSGVVIGEKAYCRCRNPSGCPDNNCAWSITPDGDVAECSGGCYQSDGDPCTSCQVFSTPGTSDSL